MVAYLALFVAVGTGSALAAATIGPRDIKRNAVKTRHVQAGAIAAAKIRADAVGTTQVADDGLTGDDVLESSLAIVPDADAVDGRSASSFISGTLYRRESAVAAGTALGDGTHVATQACDAGDRMLSGGPANIAAETDLLESFPANTTTWQARVNKNGGTDNFNVVVLCADQ